MARHDISPVTLGELAASVSGEVAIIGDVDTRITGVTQDSRDVQEGDLFCCIVGDTHDGHLHAPEAVERGAVALVVERTVTGRASGVARLEVPDVRRIIGGLASRAFGRPADSLRVVGITGTNGKTSTATILGSILATAGSSVRVMGTLTGERTTAEAIDLQASFRAAVDDGLDTIVMEVSSHALAQHRVDGTVFALSIFTNLGRDHLDYHGTMEAYFAAKARLFTADLSRTCVVNVDDPHGRLIADTADIPVTEFGLADAADAIVEVASVSFMWRGRRMTLPVGGGFMLMNAIAAVTAAEQLGVSPDDIVRGCAAVGPIRGRFQSLVSPSGFSVVVDYAHTPEALMQLLTTVRGVADGRVILVFGCGGDRDRGKRPLMGEVAATLAHEVIITSDNPRGEDPQSIIDDIVAGAQRGGAPVETIVDRADAIASAISRAGRGDIVVIAGKGHESVQEIGGVSMPFDDLDVAGAIVADLSRRDAGEESAGTVSKTEQRREGDEA